MDPDKELELKAPESEVLFGMAKKFTLELEKYPLHSQATVVQMMKNMTDHRKVELETRYAVQQKRLQDEAMDSARKAHADKAVREMVSGSSPLLVRPEDAKEPRVLVSTER